MFLKALKANKSNTQLNENQAYQQHSIPSINSIEEQEVERKNDIYKKFSVGIARTVLNQAQEDDQKQQQQKEKQMLELERQSKNGKYLFGATFHNNGIIKSMSVSIKPLSIDQRAQAEQKRMINDVFSQVEHISKTGFKQSFTNLPLDNQKLPTLPNQSNAHKRFSNILVTSPQAQAQNEQYPRNNQSNRSSLINQQQMMQTNYNEKSQPDKGKQFFGLTSPNNFSVQSQPQQSQQQMFSNQQMLYQQSQKQYSQSPQMQQNFGSVGNKGFSSQTGGSNMQTSSLQQQQQYQNASSKKPNTIKIQDQNSFTDEFTIEMPNYQRYRTFFFKPLERENMFEGMKYIQYEQYVRKDNQMQNVMTLDLTKILSDKCYTFKTTISDKPKMKRIFESLRPQLKIEVNKRLEETISLFESIAYLLMQDFRDSLKDVGISESPLEMYNENRAQYLNIFFKNMYQHNYIEHIYNQIYEEEFQEKFMEQTLQEQFEIIFTIKKNLITLCEKIEQKMRFYQEHQDIYQIEQFKLEDDSEFKEYLKSIEAIIYQTKQLPSTHAVQEIKKNQKKPVKKKKLLNDSSFESDKSIEVICEVFRVKPLPAENKEQPKTEITTRKINQQASMLASTQMLTSQQQVPSIQIINPQITSTQIRLMPSQSNDTNINNPVSGSQTGQNQEQNHTPYKRKILRNFDSQNNSPQSEKADMIATFSNNESKVNTPKMMQSQSQGSSQQPIQSQYSRNLMNLQSQQTLLQSNYQIQQQQQPSSNPPQAQMRNIQASSVQQNKPLINRKIDFGETNNKLLQDQHKPYKKLLIKDIGDEFQVFDDNLILYEKTADFLRDCIDSFRVMCRQKEFNKFDEYSIKKFLRYATKVRFNISELCEQFRNYEKSVEQRQYWKSVMSKTMSSNMNFQSAQKFAMRTNTASQMTSPHKIMNSDSQENIHTETKKQRIGRLQSILADKFNFSKRAAQTRESKVELNNQKFESEKQLLMDSHLAPEEVTHVIADNRRKLALQRLRNPFIEPFKKSNKLKLQQSKSQQNLHQQNPVKGNETLVPIPEEKKVQTLNKKQTTYLSSQK